MKLDCSRHGSQFFFVTLAVAERRAVLSRIIGEKSRPELTYVGELTRAALRAVHLTWPGATVSDYVIMPDHIHYLLIVGYDRDRNINPLFISHRVADVVEMAVAEEWTGAHAPAPPTNTCAIAPSTGAAAFVPTIEAAAPEFNADELVDKMAGLFKFAIRLANIRAAANSLKEEHGLKFGEIVCDIPTAIGDGKAIMGAGARAPVRSVVFARECHIELSFDSRQLKAIRHYIHLNPARSIWKRSHPDLFLCHRAIKSKRLASFAPMSFDGIGALTLLGSPTLAHSRRLPSPSPLPTLAHLVSTMLPPGQALQNTHYFCAKVPTTFVQKYPLLCKLRPGENATPTRCERAPDLVIVITKPLIPFNLP